MKVLMIGTPTCIKCKNIAPTFEEYCSNHCISYSYKNIAELSKEEMNILVSKNVRSAPAFFIYKDEGDILVVSGDDIFIELESLSK